MTWFSGRDLGDEDPPPKQLPPAVANGGTPHEPTALERAGKQLRADARLRRIADARRATDAMWAPILQSLQRTQTRLRWVRWPAQ